MSSRDASHGFSRSLRARIAGTNEPGRQSWLDRYRHQLRGIVSISRRLSRPYARDACMLWCHAQRNEAGRYRAGRTGQRPRDDRSLSVTANRLIKLGPMARPRSGRYLRKPMACVFESADAGPESLLNVSLIPCRRVAEVFRVPRPLVKSCRHRNDRSKRSEARPLCPIPEPKSNVDAYGIDCHGHGPVGERRRFGHAQALDRHGHLDAGYHSLTLTRR
jgi:hypothetical protein